jgi:hypothetical protein
VLGRLVLGLLLAAALGTPAPADPAPAPSDEHAQAREPKKKKKRKKDRKKRSRRRSREPEPPGDDEAIEISVVATEAAAATPPAGPLVTGNLAVTVPVPEPPWAPEPSVVVAEPRRPRKQHPTWFFGVRGGPSLIDRDGYYDFRSNRQTYHDQRNVRGEVALGRYLGRYLSLGLAGGSGPYPKFDAPDPILEENTRFSVYVFQARLDLDLHVGWFVLGIGAGGAYEHTTGSFMLQAPATTYTATFKRKGVVGAARTGVQLRAGPIAIELIAEAAMLKLGRGTYEHGGTTSAGLSDQEQGYMGSLLLGLKLQ